MRIQFCVDNSPLKPGDDNSKFTSGSVGSSRIWSACKRDFLKNQNKYSMNVCRSYSLYIIVKIMLYIFPLSSKLNKDTRLMKQVPILEVQLNIGPALC